MPDRRGEVPDRRGEVPDRRDEDPDRRDEDTDPLEGYFYQPNVNQARHEPMPASHDDDRPQEAVRQNEAHARHAAGAESRRGQGSAPGELTPGPEDPATAPTMLTAGAHPGDEDRRVRRVSRAVRGKPDGEVDPGSTG